MLTHPRGTPTGSSVAPASISPEYPGLSVADAAIVLTPAIHISGELGRYTIRLATTEAEREAACRLRFKVFNLELGEGLISSYSTGMDKDQFDYVCDHLIVKDRSSGEVVGTYRMQSGSEAAKGLGY